MDTERVLRQEQWVKTNFPFHPMPSSVSGVVDNTAWDKRISELLDSQ